MQPRWLIAEFDERNHEQGYLLELLREYYELQRQLKILSDEYLVRAQICYSNELRDSEDRNSEHIERRQQAGYLEHSTQDMHHATQANIDSCERLTERTSALVHTWEKQVHLASGWVNRATRERESAEAELTYSQSNLSSAESLLSNAEAALAYKRTQYTVRHYKDSNGKWREERIPADTTAERAAVARAAAAVARCKSAVAAAESRLAQAREDLRAARVQLQDAQFARDDAHTADTTARNALDYAGQACKSSVHSLNQCDDIDHLMQIMDSTLSDLGEEVDYQGATLAQMNELNTSVRIQLQRIDHDISEIIQQTFQLKNVLTDKADLLYAFDSPE